MATITPVIVKNTHQEVVVKVVGIGDGTIVLADLASAGQQAISGGTPTVNIVGAGWTGLLTSAVTIARGASTILTAAPENSGYMDFGGQQLPPDTVGNTSNIVVTISGATAAVWLKLRKIDGFESFIEDAAYGEYDDPTRVGASTTINGSPDKV